MPVTAVPKYMGTDFSSATPGMRFGLFLPIWTDRQDQEKEVQSRAVKNSPEAFEIKNRLENDGMDSVIKWLRQRDKNPLPGLWEKNKSAADKAWKSITRLTPQDNDAISALIERQQAIASSQHQDAALFTLPAESIAPFATGLGNEHPLENGFAFLWPYGLPYLPGSGVKGVLRQAARELANGEWGETHGWSKGKTITVTSGKEKLNLSIIDLLFGLESEDRSKQQFRGVLIFWDVICRISGNSLMVEIMTPHQGHYYQQGEAPHDSGQPIPNNFLTVPPGSGFLFHVQCDEPRLRKLASELAENTQWKKLLQAAFEHAFDWLGFGAKTAVGYGAMKIDKRAEEAARKNAEEEKRKLAESEAERLRLEAEEAEEAIRRAEYDALPESEKALRKLEEDLSAFPDRGPLDKNRYAELAGILNQFVDQALTWSDPDAKKTAADKVQDVYDRLGWTPIGLKADKRKKQEKKKRTILAKLNG